MKNHPQSPPPNDRGMSNRARFRLTCTVLNVVVIAATVAIIEPQMCKVVYSSVINSIKKTIKNVSNKVKPCQYLE